MRTREALIPRRLDQVLVRTASTPSNLVSVSIASGAVRPLLGDVQGMSWLGTEDAVLAWRGSWPSYEVWVVPLDGRPPSMAERTACSWMAEPAGRGLYVVRNCNAGGAGDLVELLPPAAPRVVAAGVSSSSTVISSDGRWVAFLGSLQQPPGCALRGTAHVFERGAAPRAVASGVLSTLAFVAGGHLILHRDVACSDDIDLLGVAPGATAPTVLAPRMAMPYRGWFGTASATSDGKLVLASTSTLVPSTADVFAVKTDGTGSLRLANDVFPWMMISMAFVPYGFTADGAQVVYAAGPPTPSGVSLRAVSPTGGPSRQLATSLSSPAAYWLSPRGDDVAFLNAQGAAGTPALTVSSAATATPRAQYTPGSTLAGISRITFRPDGAAVLFVEGSSAGARQALTQLPVDGGPARELGLWGRGALMMSGYTVDRGSCVALFDSDAPSAPGTWLVALR